MTQHVRHLMLTLLISAGSLAQASSPATSFDDSHTEHRSAPHQFGATLNTFALQVPNTINLHFDVLEMEMARANITTPLKVKIDKMINFNSVVKNKIYQTQRVLDAIFDSQEFYNAVINHTYQGRKQFADNRGYTNEQIYNMIQLGKEKYARQVDRLMNLKLKMYYENSSTVGWTYSNSDLINVNKKFYASYTPAKISRNLMHEWLHNLGFSHDARATARREYSVPYAIGYLVERLAKKY